MNNMLSNDNLENLLNQLDVLLNEVEDINLDIYDSKIQIEKLEKDIASIDQYNLYNGF